MEIGAIIAAIAGVVGLVTLCLRLFGQGPRDREKHEMELAREKDRVAEKEAKNREKKRQLDVDEEKYRDGMKQWEIDGGGLLKDMDFRRAGIEDQFKRSFQKVRDDHNARGVFHSSMREEAEKRVQADREKAERDLLTWKEEQERKLAARRKALDQEHARIAEERKWLAKG